MWLASSNIQCMLKVFLQFKMQTQRRIMTIFLSKLWLCFLTQYIVEAEVASAGSISFKSMKCDPSESELLPVIYKNEIENPISPDYKSVHGNCQVNLKFYCSAAYPVEWVEYYDRSKVWLAHLIEFPKMLVNLIVLSDFCSLFSTLETC